MGSVCATIDDSLLLSLFCSYNLSVLTPSEIFSQTLVTLHKKLIFNVTPRHTENAHTHTFL